MGNGESLVGGGTPRMRKSNMKLLKVDMKCARKCSRSVQYFLESKRFKKIIVGGIFRICKHFRSEQALVYIYSLSSSVCLNLHTNLRMHSWKSCKNREKDWFTRRIDHFVKFVNKHHLCWQLKIIFIFHEIKFLFYNYLKWYQYSKL